VKMWEERQSAGDASQNKNAGNRFATEWFSNRLSEVRLELEAQFREFRLSEALKTIYSLIWDDFCSWYLEWIKPPASGNIEKVVFDKTVDFFNELMQLLHPFMPFITEEVYHILNNAEEDIIITQIKPVAEPDKEILVKGDLLKQAITAIRDARNKNQLKPRDAIKLHIQSPSKTMYQSIEDILSKQVNADLVEYAEQAPGNAIAVVVEKDKFFIEAPGAMNRESQVTQLQKDLEYLRGFLASVEKKLGNERFVQNAKAEVIEVERKKKADAEAKIKIIEESLRDSES
jgi:valyl-tRNA synthetase